MKLFENLVAGYHDFPSTVQLRFWSIDDEKELATSISALKWATQAGLVPETESDDTPASQTGGAFGPA
ncbi:MULTISPECIES: hypothetical protein [Bradyrhizobium]|uniref:hypothetical protein n=1 Tax=Bradyrhizobium TaxID=374 RepID=UPI001EDC4488|nr:hypothetical protein [Bradyrhizobium zhengyangense]MCG2641429.1 hypothetical protein [Bradyrhizobium zhengyangense]